jgi:dihydroorotase-like cyclic amidohydrolase
MRSSAIFCLALALTGASVVALAQDDDAPPPSTQTQSDDAKFVAYNQPVIAFTHAEILDGTGAAPLFDQTLVIANGRIEAIGPSASATVPAGATVIDAHGQTLLPGFVMAHEHLFYPMGHGNYASMLYSFPRLYLAGERPPRAQAVRCRPMAISI